MKKFLSRPRGKTLLFLFIVTTALTQTSCNRHLGKGGGVKTNHVSNWLNWNFVFKEGIDSATRRMTIESITGQVRSVSSDTNNPNYRRYIATAVNNNRISPDYNSYLSNYLRKIIRKKNGFSLEAVQVHFCSCHDTLLWNLTSDLAIGGSGQSAPNSPPPPGPGAQGDPISLIDSNGALSSPISAPPLLTTGLVSFDAQTQVTDQVVLGIIDTGIDPALFAPGIYNQLFASDGSGTVNFVPYAPVTGFRDDDPVRHGSAVAAIALDAFYAESVKAGKPQLPRLMVLKALDSTGMGNTLTVSCALSYAIRHHISLINASLGYWNTQNNIINYYLQQSAKNFIPVVAAAGNTPGKHREELCGEGHHGHNRLHPGNLFFPACQSIDPQYCIVSVTGLSNPLRPCRYQNFSSDYVSVGVVNDLTHNSSHNTCCGFSLPFINNSYVLDGSSFATPVISGELGYKILKSGTQHSVAEYMQLLQANKTTHDFLTWSGQYITY